MSFFDRLISKALGSSGSTGATGEDSASYAIKVSRPFEIISSDNKSHEITGKLLSGPNAPGTNDRMRKQCALFDNGLLLVVKGAETDGQVRSFKAMARQTGIQITDEIRVDTITLQSVYDKVLLSGTNILAARARSAKDDTASEKQLMDLISRCAAIEASDLHVNRTRTKCEVEIDVMGELEKGDIIGFPELLIEDGERVMATAHSLAEEGAAAATYQRKAFQEGRIVSNEHVQLPDNLESLRLQWNPTAGDGRYMVVRFLYQGKRESGNIDRLGYSRGHVDLFTDMRTRPQGITVVAAPTGNGKTTTIVCTLRTLYQERNQRTNIITVENPCEYHIEGAKQLPVASTTSLAELSRAYEQAIAASLRSHPHVLFIGEIRDEASAKLAMQAVTSSHQVFTTLHTASAGAIPRRLIGLGIHPDELFEPGILSGLIAQRLVKTVCPHCSRPFPHKVREWNYPEALERRVQTFVKKIGGDIEAIRLANPGGCTFCKNGHAGRTVTAEMIQPESQWIDLIARGKAPEAREFWLGDQGGATVLAHAIYKMMSGQISPEQIERFIDLIRYEEWMGRVFNGDRYGEILTDVSASARG